jgi:NAD(P)-dependent dehydrogenase (short-subunit alcohol dehydrogenase family)
LQELEEHHWAKAIDVNLRGVVNGVSAAYPHVRAQGPGTSSTRRRSPDSSRRRRCCSYTTTKHAVVGLSTALRAEAASQGVRVSVLGPAFVDTPLLDDVYAAPASLGGSAVRARVRLMQPRILTAEHVARRAVDGMAANKAVIPVGFLAHGSWRLLRYAPPLARAAIQGQASAHRRLNERAARRVAASSRTHTSR